MSKKTKVSIVMVVKDEEKFLGQCLKSCHDVSGVYEIIVVDTGSTDKTKEIALSFPKVKYFYKTFTPWSFKNARNFSIKKATGNWLMYLDADEVLQGSFPDDLPEAIFNFKIQNVTDNGDFVNSFCARMIPNIKGVEFINDVHEILASQQKPLAIHIYPHASIIHYGYTAQVRSDKNKLARNIEMLTKDYSEKPTSQNAYYLGQETFITGNYERSIELAKDGIARLDPANALDQTFEPILYHLLVSSMIEAKRQHADIEEFEMKYAFKRPNPEISTVLTSYYLGRHDPQKAGFYCMQAMKLKNSPELPVKYNENTIKFVPYILMGEYYYRTVGDNLAGLYWFELAHMGGCNDPGILTTIYQLLPKYKDIPKLDYYLKKLHEITKDNNFLKELVNVYLNSNTPDLEKQAVDLMNKIANSAELEQFRIQLIANGKGVLTADLKQIELVKLPHSQDICNAVTVIIPTMFKADPEYLRYNLEQLQHNIAVKEILIIDNQVDDAVGVPFELLTFDKIRILGQDGNIGFNQSVNEGVEHCTTPYYLVLNDDCLIRSDIVHSAVNLFENKEDAGMMVVNTIPKEPLAEYSFKYIDAQEDVYEQYDARNGSQYGWCMFAKKEHFVPFPLALHTFFGDNLLHFYSWKNKQKTFMLKSNYVSHEISKTVEQVYGNLNDPKSEYNRKLKFENDVYHMILQGK